MTSVHGRADDARAVRVVEGGFRPSVFFLAPAALLARKLWIACLVWLVLVGGFAGASAAGYLAIWAAALAILVVHFVLAIDAPELERRRLYKRGWSTVAVIGPGGTLTASESARAP